MTRLRAAIPAAFLLAGVATAVADEFRLHARVGQCDYTFAPAKNERHTKCSAEAYIVNAQTSEIYSCRADVEGDQFVAPSVIESAPETIVCTRIGQPFARSGSFDIAHADDTAKSDRTQNRLQGVFSWKNALWIYSRSSLEVKFCTNRMSEAAPDFRMSCSKKVEWRK